MSTDGWSRRTSVLLAACGLVALVLRALHLHALAPLLLEEPPGIGMDRWLAMQTAEGIAAGQWLGWLSEFDSAPAYAYWIAALYRLSGGQWLPALVVQIALGSLTCALIAWIGHRLWSPAVGLLGAALMAVYAPAIFYETLLVKFSVVSFLVALVLATAVEARRRRTAAWVCAAGVALGGLVAVRTNAALVLPAVLVWIGVGAGSGRRAASLTATFVAGLSVVALPLVVRHHAASERELATSLWGIHFYIGTHAEADGGYVPIEGVSDDAVGHVVDARRIAERALERRLTPREVSWYWFGRGIESIRADPWRFAVLEARKLRLAFSGFEDGSFGDDFGATVKHSWVLRLPLLTFGVVCPLGMLGAFISLHRRRGALIPWFVASYVFSLLLVFVTGRYRLPIVAPMIILAAVGVGWIADRWHRRTYRALLAAGLFLCVASLALPARAQDRWTMLGVVVFGVTMIRTPSESFDDVPERA